MVSLNKGRTVNIDTNEVVTAAELARMSPRERAAFAVVPDYLSRQAKRVLGHTDRAYVPRSSKSPLAKWAAEQRRKRRQMQRESRRANRR